MKSDELLDVIEDLGLTERQTIGTLLNELEEIDEDDDESDFDDDLSLLIILPESLPGIYGENPEEE